MLTDYARLMFAAAALLLLWVLFIYPLLLSWRARARTRPQFRPLERLPAVSVLLPAYNGAEFLAAKLDSVLHSDYPAESLDVIVISDGSSDATVQIAKDYESTGRVRVLNLQRGGKALAINAGLRVCDRELILLTDVRQVLDVNCVRLLVQHFADPAVGVVSGSLRIRATNDDSAASVGMYRRYEDWIRSSLAAIDSTIGATGAIYAMRGRLTKPLPAGCILDDMWLPLQAVFAGKRATVADECVVWDYPTDARSEFRRKVRTQAGLYQLLKQEPRLLMPWTNRLWGAFVSLKLGRLFMPHLLLICFLCGFFLPSIWRAMALAGQGCLYGAALIDRIVPPGSRLKRLTSVCHTFAVLMFAAFFAQSILFRNPETLWTSTSVQKEAK